MVNWITNAFHHYGYIVLFVSLFFELLALPLPGELLMSSAGLMVYEGKLNLFVCIVIGGLGASLGMTAAYAIGYRLGLPFVHKYGKYVHFGPERLNKTSHWFTVYGNKLLAVSYFIPGVRHFTGYFAGIVRIPFRTFAIYSYMGAFIWVGAFVSLGKLLGPKWEQFHRVITRYLFVGIMILCVIVISIYVIKKYQHSLARTLQMWLEKGVSVFHSFGRIKMIVAFTAFVFLCLFFFTMGLIQDYLAQEFDTFNEVVTLIAGSVTEDITFEWAKPASVLVSLPTVTIISALILIWIARRGKDKPLEFLFLFLSVVGGEVWGELLTGVFHRISPPALKVGLVIGSESGFPSEPTLFTITVYGYAAYMVFRHASNLWVKSAIMPTFVAILLWVGCNDLIYANQLPSDIVAGFSFGGVWISMQIVLLEVFRLIRQSNLNNQKAYRKKSGKERRGK